jgi:hypothetical protein
MNSASPGFHVARERLVEPGPVEQQKTVLRRQNRRSGLGRQIGNEPLHRLAGVRHEGRDVNQRLYIGVGTGLADHRSAVGVANENYGLALRVDDTPCRVGVACQRDGRILYDADAVAILGQLVVNASPAGAVYETAVNENDGAR